MIVYHEVDPSALQSVIKHGLKRKGRGEKGNDSLIAKTDQFLDSLCPVYLRQAGVSRDDNLYAYLSFDGRVTDITSGNDKSVDTLIENSKQAVLKLAIEPDVCYVSDLELYDQVKKAINDGEKAEKLVDLAERYWKEVVPLSRFNRRDMRRPEVMITSDVPPDSIELLKSGSD